MPYIRTTSSSRSLLKSQALHGCQSQRNRSKMVQTSYVSLLAAIATIAAATGSAATSVVIYSTVVNTSNNQITITGNKFSPSGQTGSAKATFGWISDSAQVCSTPRLVCSMNGVSFVYCRLRSSEAARPLLLRASPASRRTRRGFPVRHPNGRAFGDEFRRRRDRRYFAAAANTSNARHPIRLARLALERIISARLASSLQTPARWGARVGPGCRRG